MIDEVNQEIVPDFADPSVFDDVKPEDISFGDEDETREEVETKEEVVDTKETETGEEKEETEEEKTETETEEEEEKTEEEKTEEKTSEENIEKTAEVEPEQSESQAFEQLSEISGVQVGTPDDLVSALKELANLRSDNYSGLSKPLQEAIGYEKKGGDIAHYFQVKSLPVDSLKGKEVLMHKYFQQHPELYNKAPDLAAKRFDREYDAKFGILEKKFEDDDEREEFLSENADDMEMAKLDLEYSIDEARTELKSMQEDKLKIENPDTGMTQEQEDVFGDQYDKDVKSFMGEFESIPLQIDPDQKVNIGVSGEILENTNKHLANPKEWLKEIGISDSKIDVEKLAPVVAWYNAYKNVGGELKKLVLENSEKESVKSIMQNTGAEQTAAGGGAEKSLDEELGEAFQSKFG